MKWKKKPRTLIKWNDYYILLAFCYIGIYNNNNNMEKRERERWKYRN